MLKLEVKLSNSNSRGAAEFVGPSITFLVPIDTKIWAMKYANGFEV
jgi:hypothetical protein